MLTLLWLLPTAGASAHVIDASSPKRLKRAMRAAHAATVERVVVQDPLTVCVELDDAAPRTLIRITRRLGHAPEPRMDCDVAWYPLGRGWIVGIAEPPARSLEAALDTVNVSFREVSRSTDPTTPVRFCMARAAVPDPDALKGQLEAHGVGVRAIYEVGGCRR